MLTSCQYATGAAVEVRDEGPTGLAARFLRAQETVEKLGQAKLVEMDELIDRIEADKLVLRDAEQVSNQVLSSQVRHPFSSRLSISYEEYLLEVRISWPCSEPTSSTLAGCRKWLARGS